MNKKVLHAGAGILGFLAGRALIQTLLPERAPSCVASALTDPNTKGPFSLPKDNVSSPLHASFTHSASEGADLADVVQDTFALPVQAGGMLPTDVAVPLRRMEHPNLYDATMVMPETGFTFDFEYLGGRPEQFTIVPQDDGTFHLAYLLEGRKFVVGAGDGSRRNPAYLVLERFLHDEGAYSYVVVGLRRTKKSDVRGHGDHGRKRYQVKILVVSPDFPELLGDDPTEGFHTALFGDSLDYTLSQLEITRYGARRRTNTFFPPEESGLLTQAYVPSGLFTHLNEWEEHDSSAVLDFLDLYGRALAERYLGTRAYAGLRGKIDAVLQRRHRKGHADERVYDLLALATHPNDGIDTVEQVYERLMVLASLADDRRNKNAKQDALLQFGRFCLQLSEQAYQLAEQEQDPAERHRLEGEAVSYVEDVQTVSEMLNPHYAAGHSSVLGPMLTASNRILDRM